MYTLSQFPYCKPHNLIPKVGVVASLLHVTRTIRTASSPAQTHQPSPQQNFPQFPSRNPHLINQHKHKCVAVLHQLMDARKQAPHQLAALWGHVQQRRQHRHTTKDEKSHFSRRNGR